MDDSLVLLLLKRNPVLKLSIFHFLYKDDAL